MVEYDYGIFFCQQKVSIAIKDMHLSMKRPWCSSDKKLKFCIWILQVRKNSQMFLPENKQDEKITKRSNSLFYTLILLLKGKVSFPTF